MNVIIERALSVSEDLLEDYGIDGLCLHMKVRAIYRAGLEDLSDQVMRGDYRKLPISPLPPGAVFEDASSQIMLQFALESSGIPGQVGLIIVNVDGFRTLYCA